MISQERTKEHAACGGGGVLQQQMCKKEATKRQMAAQEWNQMAAMASCHPKKDLMVDINGVESGGKEETQRYPILRFFSMKGGSQFGFLVHNDPQV